MNLWITRPCKAPRKGKIKPFLIGKELKRKDLRQTAERRASGSPQNQNQNPRIASAERLPFGPSTNEEAILWKQSEN